MVQIIMVVITVIIKYLKGNLTGIGLNVNFFKRFDSFKKTYIPSNLFERIINKDHQMLGI